MRGDGEEATGLSTAGVIRPDEVQVEQFLGGITEVVLPQSGVRRTRTPRHSARNPLLSNLSLLLVARAVLIPVIEYCQSVLPLAE